MKINDDSIKKILTDNAKIFTICDRDYTSYHTCKELPNLPFLTCQNIMIWFRTIWEIFDWTDAQILCVAWEEGFSFLKYERGPD